MSKKTGTSTGYLVKSSSTRSKPEFGISEKELPAIKDWKVGQKYSLELNVEMVSSSKGSDYDSPWSPDGKERPQIHQARFKILSVDSEEGAKKSVN